MILPVINKIARLFFIITFIAAFSLSSDAAPGKLDASFNNHGIVRPEPGFGYDDAYGVAQADGKIVAAGGATDSRPAVAGFLSE